MRQILKIKEIYLASVITKILTVQGEEKQVKHISIISFDCVEDNGGKIQGAWAIHNLENLTNLSGGIKR